MSRNPLGGEAEKRWNEMFRFPKPKSRKGEKRARVGPEWRHPTERKEEETEKKKHLFPHPTNIPHPTSDSLARKQSGRRKVFSYPPFPGARVTKADDAASWPITRGRRNSQSRPETHNKLGPGKSASSTANISFFPETILLSITPHRPS